MALLVVGALVGWLLCFCFDPILPRSSPYGSIAWPTFPPETELAEITVMTANVGNSDFDCREHYFWGLCFNDVEERLTRGIARIRPDVITMQEITDPAQCEGWHEADPDKVCYDYESRQPFRQVRRLLGPNYTIACESRNRWDCTAVHVEAGYIEGCPLGGHCDDVSTSDVPLPDCDAGFTVSAVTAVLNGVPIRVINGHPSGYEEICRAYAVQQIFETVDGRPPLANDECNLMMGDMNMDPFRQNDSAAQLWNLYTGTPDSGKPFVYHSGPVEHWPPYDTFYLGPFRRVLDFVVSDFAVGSCEVLGVTSGTERIDGGSGTDHRSLFCRLRFPRVAVVP